jgi:hypothetical protein
MLCIIWSARRNAVARSKGVPLFTEKNKSCAAKQLCQAADLILPVMRIVTARVMGLWLQSVHVTE